MVYNWEINFLFDDGSKSFLYYDLDSLLNDLKFDLFEYVRSSRFTTIRRYGE